MRVLLRVSDEHRNKKKKYIYGDKKVCIPKLGSLWINSDQPRTLLAYCHRQKEHTHFLSWKKKKINASVILYFPEIIEIALENWLPLWGCYSD